METLQYVNKHLPKAVSWQEDPLIQNEHIKMSGKVEIFHPNWNHGFDIPNDCSKEKIVECIKEHKADLQKKGIAA